MKTRFPASRFALAAALLLVAPAAQAVTFDFGALARTPGPRGHASLEMTAGAFSLTATASLAPPGDPPEPGDPSEGGTDPLHPSPPDAFVYLKDFPDPLAGGVGVCPLLDAQGMCDSRLQSTVETGQFLTLVFNVPVILEGILFRDASGGTSFGSEFALSINGDDLDFHPLSHTFSPSSTLSGTSFTFGGVGDVDYYIESVDVNAVPEPGTLGLLGMGLFAVAARLRRR